MSKTVVMKFGGTSVGSTERIGAVADRVASHIRKTGDKVVVVVSAMSGETDRMIELCRKVGAGKHNEREYHQLLASGEQVSSALTAMAIQRLGLESQALLAHQVALRTEKIGGQVLIKSVDSERLEKLLEDGFVPVVAGFQGINDESEFETLGRGGSDTSAVALAAALKADRCMILTDVDGVFTASPGICKQARQLSHLNYEEMLELASAGAKVLQTRSVHLARKFRVPVEVCSSFNSNPGSLVSMSYEGMEDNVVSGVTCLSDQAKVTLRDLPDEPGIASSIFDCVGEAGIVVDMIVKNQGDGRHCSMSFTVPEADSQKIYEALVPFLNENYRGVTAEIDRNIAKLSVVGEGMRSHSGIAAEMFAALGREGINIDMITTSEIKISVAIHQKYSELAVRTLHERFIEHREELKI